jgi:hypothetical protein
LAPWGYRRGPLAPLPEYQAFLDHTTTPKLRDHTFEVFERDLSAFLSHYSPSLTDHLMQGVRDSNLLSHLNFRANPDANQMYARIKSHTYDMMTRGAEINVPYLLLNRNSVQNN